jgi:hypothetical protein
MTREESEREFVARVISSVLVGRTTTKMRVGVEYSLAAVSEIWRGRAGRAPRQPKVPEKVQATFHQDSEPTSVT